MSRHPKSRFRYKSIRDPLYGFIDLSKLETRILDTVVFRRLHSIKQLSHAYVVYPSAIHTRLEHSLGCLYVANRMCDELELTPDETETVRLAALLHDIGHGPFSHLFESVIKKVNPSLSKPHEDITSLIIKEHDELAPILDSRRDDITKLLNPEKISLFSDHKTSLLSNIVTSGLDADKLDYLRRDSYHIGVAYGQFDLERILHTIRRTPIKQSRICIDIKGKDALENYRLGRYLMHVQVYEHHARLVADQMFLQAINLALEEDIIDRSDLTLRDGASNKDFLKFYLSLDDNSIYDLIMQNKNSTSKEILINIKQRRLLKRACEFTLHSIEGHADIGNDLKIMSEDNFGTIASEVSQELGLKKHEVIFHKSKIEIKLFKEGDILVLKDNEVYDLQGSSPIAAKDQVFKFYVFGPRDPDTRKKIANEIASRLNVPVSKISSA